MDDSSIHDIKKKTKNKNLRLDPRSTGEPLSDLEMKHKIEFKKAETGQCTGWSKGEKKTGNPQLTGSSFVIALRGLEGLAPS